MIVRETKEGVVCPRCHCPDVPVIKKLEGKRTIKRLRVCGNHRCVDRNGEPTKFWTKEKLEDNPPPPMTSPADSP